MSGLLNLTPDRMQMILGGIGLLGSKTKNSSNNYLSMVNQGLLGRSQLNQQEKENARKKEMDELTKRNIESQINARNTPALIKPTSDVQNYEYSRLNDGYSGSFLDFQNSLSRAKSSRITNNINNIPKPPQNYLWIDPLNPSKGVKEIPGSGAGSLSGEKAKLKEIASGGKDSTNDLIGKMSQGEIDQITMGGAQILPNFMQTKTMQEFEMLRQDLADRLGRLRSGGAITKDEEVRFIGQIPRFGDHLDVIDKKLGIMNQVFSRIDTSVSNTPLPNKSQGNESLDDLLKIYGD